MELATLTLAAYAAFEATLITILRPCVDRCGKFWKALWASESKWAPHLTYLSKSSLCAFVRVLVKC